MKALVYHGPGQQGLGGRPRRHDPGPDRRRRPGGHDHDLRHRPAHPAGRRRRGDRRPDPRPRGRRHGHRGRRGGERLRRRRPGAGPGHHQVRPVRVLPARHAVALPDRRRHRLDLRPPHRRHAGRVGAGARTPTPRSTRSPRTSPTSRRSSWPTRCPPATRWACSPAACGPATRSRSSAPARSACPRSSRPACGARRR